MLIIEVNKAEQLRAKNLSDFNEFHRMNNSDEIIEANPTLAGRKLTGYNDGLMSFVGSESGCGAICENEEESSIDQRISRTGLNYPGRSIGHRNGQMCALSPPKVSELITYDSGHYTGYLPTGYTNSLIEYDDLYVDQQQQIDEPDHTLANVSSLMNGQQLIGQQLIDQNLINQNLIHQNLINSNLIDQNLISSGLLYNKELLSEDLDLSTLIVPPPPKLDANLEEQDELLRNFQKATNELKNICQSCQSNQMTADLDYSNGFVSNSFGSGVQVARDLHSSSSSADSGYESVLLINNSQKLVDINQKLISNNLSNFADSRSENCVLANHCIIAQPPKAPPRLNKLKGKYKVL